MYIKVRPYQRAHAQRIADLAQDLRYLLQPKEYDSAPNFMRRLAGPPIVDRLVQRIFPYGSSTNEAAYDLAQQVFNHARDSELTVLPDEIYKHVLISFPRNARHHKFASLSEEPRVQFDSTFYGRNAVIRELLDALGISETAPKIIVQHADTQNWHGHVIVGMYAKEFNCSSTFKRLNIETIKETALTLYPAHGWKFPTNAQKEIYLRINRKTANLPQIE